MSGQEEARLKLDVLMPTVTQLLIEIFFSPALSFVCVDPAEYNWGCLLWQTVKIQEKHGRKQPQTCSVLLYTHLCTLYLLPFSFPTNSSVPLHKQARYLHSFSVLNCALKKPVPFLKLLIICQDLWWHPLPLILNHSHVFSMTESGGFLVFFLFFSLTLQKDRPLLLEFLLNYPGWKELSCGIEKYC